jgi:DNA-binding PadR family transcriptional regulator
MGSSSRPRRRRLSVADLVVLSLIAEGPRHGYAVYAELRRRNVEEWASVSRAQIYYSLDKLAAEGHIMTAHDAAAALGPERAVFRLAATGKRALRNALGEISWATRTEPAPFLTWALLAWYATPEARSAIIAERRRFLDARIAQERETIDAIRRDDPHATTPIVVLELVIDQLQTERAWLARLERDRWITTTGAGTKKPR